MKEALVTEKDMRDLLSVVNELARMCDYESFCKRDNYRNHTKLQRLTKKYAKKVGREDGQVYGRNGWPL